MDNLLKQFDTEHIYININNNPEHSIPISQFRGELSKISIIETSYLFKGYVVITKYEIEN